VKHNHEIHYLAFLLRLWREGAKAPWRATLENPHTDERHSFGDLQALVAFLEQVTGEKKLMSSAIDGNQKNVGDKDDQRI